MRTALKLRKPVEKLAVADLETFPIWEFATDEEGVEGRDETWVRPVKGADVRKGAYSQLVASDFMTSAGVRLQGFMTVTTADEIEVSPGSLVGEGYYAVLPSMSDDRARQEGLRWSIQSREEVLRVLGSPSTAVFPIAYILRVRIRGEGSLRSGMVE